MAISKRLRFEILRRDGYKCFYCHNSEDGLTIDHVVPTTLGGTDDPENLVAACPACNSGKSSATADASLVAAVDRAVAINKAARARAADALKGVYDNFPRFEERVWNIWDQYAPSYAWGRGVSGAPADLYDWFERGLPFSLIEKGFRVAWGNRAVQSNGKWSYARGVIRNTVGDAEGVLSEDGLWGMVAFHAGWSECRAANAWESHDLLAMHIDQRTDHWFWREMSLAA